MKRSTLLYLLLSIAIIIGAIFIFRPNAAGNQNPNENGIILFYGRECPHCQNLDKWISENKIEEKVQFERIEVFHNRRNAELMAAKGRLCHLPPDQGMGVPFLWDGANKKCYLGEDRAEEFFRQKAGV